MRPLIPEKAPIDDYLVHHGIKGQRWGLRRYQNEDGTLTEAGKDRYLNKVERVSKKIVSNQKKSDKYTRKIQKSAKKTKKINTKNNIAFLLDPRNKSIISKDLDFRLSHLTKKNYKFSKQTKKADKAVERLSKTLYKDIIKFSDTNKETTIAAIDSAMSVLGDKYVKDLFESRKHSVERGQGIIHSSINSWKLDKSKVSRGPERASIEDIYEDCLAHHGIKGQKWGVRRFQNPDGTLTEAGKARYAKISERAEKNSKIIRSRQAYSRESKRLASEHRADADVLQREYDKYMARGGKWNSRKAERLENKISDLVEGAIWQERSARDDDRVIERLSKVLYKDINKLSDLDHDTTIAVIDSVMDRLGDTYIEDLFEVKGKHVKRGSGIEHNDRK